VLDGLVRGVGDDRIGRVAESPEAILVVAKQDDIGAKLVQKVQTRVDVWGDWFRAVSVDATSTGAEGCGVYEVTEVDR
jgi:hypothetical protein